MIYILLSTYNGGKFLKEQLESLQNQTVQNWHILWRDDGSMDNTVPIMNNFIKETGKCTNFSEINHNLGPYASFLTLLKFAGTMMQADDCVMFADQDDVWLPEKIARAYAALSAYDSQLPALYFSRQKVVDAQLRPLGTSDRLQFVPLFPDCLAQNVATGCTMALNAEAVRVINQFTVPANIYHDWWSYIVVAAAGGRCLYDDEATILYRQHGHNAIGHKKSFYKRLVAALLRGPKHFMNLFRSHITALRQRENLLADTSRRQLACLAPRNQRIRFLSVLRMKMKRQTFAETFLFYVWVLFG